MASHYHESKVVGCGIAICDTKEMNQEEEFRHGPLSFIAIALLLCAAVAYIRFAASAVIVALGVVVTLVSLAVSVRGWWHQWLRSAAINLALSWRPWHGYLLLSVGSLAALVLAIGLPEFRVLVIIAVPLPLIMLGFAIIDFIGWLVWPLSSRRPQRLPTQSGVPIYARCQHCGDVAHQPHVRRGLCAACDNLLREVGK